MKKKVLLMGASGSGKTSMRSMIFSNNPASLTSRLGVTIDVEQNHVRFLGDLILNLWDCGGQDSYMAGYLSTQQATIFAAVGVLIYVFDLRTREPTQDADYFRQCLAALRRYSPGADVVLLVHKMDLAGQGRERRDAFARKRAELLKDAAAAAPGAPPQVFGTSIHDESLYKAWSRIVHSLIPNAPALRRHLTTFARACGATEVVLFERTTFLVVATSAIAPPPAGAAPDVDALAPRSGPASPARATPSSRLSAASDGTGGSVSASAGTVGAGASGGDGDLGEDDPAAAHGLDPVRYERTSELIKAFKHACVRVRADWRALVFEFPEFTAVLDELTKNMYVLVVVHDPTIETAAIQLNIQLARGKFEELQSDSAAGS